MSRSPQLKQTLFWRGSLIGESGVPLFFVISGYCMIQSAYALRCSRNANPQNAIAGALAFVRQRVLRIYPTYLVIAVLVFCILLSAQWLATVGRVESNEFTQFDYLHQPLIYYLSNLTLTQVFFHQKSLVYVSWTICYEIAFYLFIAICILLHSGVSANKKILTVVEVASLICLAVAMMLHEKTPFPMEWFPIFGLGAVAWRVLNTQKRWVELAPTALVVTGCFVVGLCFDLPWGYMGQMSRSIFFVSLLFLIILCAVKSWDESLSNFKGVKALAFVGKISYGVYLSHLYVIHLVDQVTYSLPNSLFFTPVTAIIAGILTLPAGYFIHLAFEKPFLLKKTKAVTLVNSIDK